jgi:hypothetical protein
MKTTITVQWTAFEKNAISLATVNRIGNAEMTFTADIPPAMFDQEILELLYEQTNLYAGDVWVKYFEDKMPVNRSHTALSVGDKVTIERNDERSVYLCENTGWELLTFAFGANVRPMRDVFQLDQDRMMSRMADAEMGDL